MLVNQPPALPAVPKSYIYMYVCAFYPGEAGRTAFAVSPEFVIPVPNGAKRHQMP
jgi:hypothetical protein